MERDFKGIWIPKEIWLTKELPCLEKILLVEIDSLAKNGSCFASNSYFAEFLNLSKKHISRLISNLVEKRFITLDIIYKKDSKEIEQRILKPSYPHRKYADTPTANMRIPHRKYADTPIRKNAEDNNTVINNTTNNTTNKNYIAEFETLWKLYPNKKGRDKALQAYIKTRKEKTEYETIKNGLERYIQYVHVQQVEKQYIKHGSTWFNQHSWQDEYELQKQKRVTSFLDFYENEYGNREDELFEFRGNDQIIDASANVLPFLPQEY